MSRLSFKAFCIEYYASHAGITGAEAYRRFEESGLYGCSALNVAGECALELDGHGL